MVAKAKIVAELGDTDLVLPDRIAASLMANDHVKYYFALLQTARANADRPIAPTPDLKSERLASHIPDSWLDAVVADTRSPSRGHYAVPHIGELLARIDAAISAMIACLPEEQAQPLRTRAAKFDFKFAADGIVPGADIDAMTSGDRERGDSPHLLVMDAHRAINALQAATATDNILGASVYRLPERSRRLVESFMSGLNRTAVLKFDHPGLATTATEHAGRLLIQNDIGTTDAHVLVLRVSELEATLTYTDIHKKRLEFFVSLFSDFQVDWQQANSRTSDTLENRDYMLTTATYLAADETALARYLEHLGSRIVFLIDWNKMRKRLRAFVPNRYAIDVLRWAAHHDFGHRGLLEAGGEQLLAEAVEYAAGEQLRYGDRLDRLIGEENAEKFLQHAMKVASIGLREGRSRRFIADEIKAELRRYFEDKGLQVFNIAARHAATGFDLAVTVREALDGIASTMRAPDSLAKRAAAWEHRADQLLNEARDDIKRHRHPAALLMFFESADDAVDELEEAASLVVLIPLTPRIDAPFDELCLLADAVLAASQELIKCIECAATISSIELRDDFDDFLKAAGRVMELEHEADRLLRSIRSALASRAESARTIYLVDLIASALEQATDAYSHAAQALRAYLLDEVLA
ncbi:DUF47 family protein [Hyphomicrobium sp. NDB2Meth4]|uniref:DUF47 family protein n=1 Tax=Hyphomicrobium sp. NDB2Meth4 TaxID=1892846 RepID=UPI0009306C01|nr:DUF47 family protein [Hyphomicrobium sp. NDB2Meth4]